MPEIKNQEVPPQKPESQFVLPTRRGYSRWIIVPIALVIILWAAWFAYGKIAHQTTSPDPEVVEQSKTETKISLNNAYYLTYDVPNYETASIYQYSGDGKPDILTGQIKEKNLELLGKYVKPYTYIVKGEGSKLQILDASSAKLDPLFDIPDNAIIRDTQLSSDNLWLAYGRSYEDGENKSYGEIWLYNLETKEQKQIGAKIPLSMYQAISIVGWRNNDTELIVSAIGGDAGAIWGDIFQVNVPSNKIDKLTVVADKEANGFVAGRLSPSKDQWLFQYCEKPDTGEDNSLVPCPDGTQLRTYDFGTKELKTVYQNLRYADNADKNILRTFMDYEWQDDGTIIAAVPGAMLSISTKETDKATELFTYNRSNPQDFKNSYIGLQNDVGGRIVFNRAESWFVFDYDSKKIIDLNPASRNEAIYYWLE
jgi:Galactose oxidase, central domain